ncbi:hypothetical protein M8J77_017966 [Diaphorina citri]|nr:hypothetical protein M8J77_017966 [Diaphorina citri]
MSDSEEFNLYLANLEEFVFDENKIVSISWLSRTLNIHVGLAKSLLSTFVNDESFKPKLSTCWFVFGTSKTDPSSKKMLIVPDNQLESVKDRFEKITSQHVYSIQKSGNSGTDMNSVYLADQSADKNIAQCSSLSNLKCDQVKIVANRRNLVAPAPPTTSNSNSKPAVSGKTTDKPGDSAKKSPVKNTIGNMFSKKNEETEKKKKDAEKSSKEQEKVNGNVKTDTDKNSKGEEKKVENKSPVKKVPVSPAKKSGITAGKKKGAEKGAGSANITSFFSKGPLPEIKKAEPAVQKPIKETKPIAKKPSNESKEIEDEAMDVEETDENEKPEVAENVEVDKNNKDSEKDKKSKGKKTSTKSANSKKTDKKKEKKEKEVQRRRIRVFSDSSESEKEEPERERSLSPPPPSPPRVDIKSATLSDDDDVIPPTPEPQSTGGRKRKRKLVTKTMTDESGFLRTVKEFETVSCSDSEGESNPVQQDTKKPKVEEKETKSKTPPASKPTKSPNATKQTSILSFFKKSG